MMEKVAVWTTTVMLMSAEIAALKRAPSSSVSTLVKLATIAAEEVTVEATENETPIVTERARRRCRVKASDMTKFKMESSDIPIKFAKEVFTSGSWSSEGAVSKAMAK
jgi:hypothetical protein